MRRLVAVFFGLVLIGILAASAADLNVEGGTIQVFTVPFEPEQLSPEVEQGEHLAGAIIEKPSESVEPLEDQVPIVTDDPAMEEQDSDVESDSVESDEE